MDEDVMLIGNDLVDLRAREAGGKAGDDRFVRRVFVPAEAAWIREASDPDLALWMLWAGKEAAYKVAKKLQPRVPFAMHRYEITAHPTSAGDPVGEARFRELSGLDDVLVSLSWEVTPDYLHCVATHSVPPEAELWIRIARSRDFDQEGKAGELSAREIESAASAESRAVRLLAKALAEGAGLGAVEVIRAALADRHRGPPRLHAAGADEPLATCDISLSHDGVWVAAALARVPSRFSAS